MTGRARAMLGMAIPLVSAWLAAAPQQSVFRAGNRSVFIYVTVQSGDRLVTDLSRDAFEIFDNGRPQPITLFENGTQPISVAIMLDMSDSMLGNLPLVRNAAVQLFLRLLPEDRARVGSFGWRVRISDEFTSDTDALIRALWTDLPPSGPTPLWPAVYQAMLSLDNVEGRRVVLVFSDGHDGGVKAANSAGQLPITVEELTERAVAEQFVVYGIGLRSWSTVRRQGRAAPRSAPDPRLHGLASESGGGYFLLNDGSDLGPTFARVADELHRQYLIGYELPEADGERHTVDVRVNPSDLTVRARKSYLAPKSN
jgi:VWFA-related protein